MTRVPEINEGKIAESRTKQTRVGTKRKSRTRTFKEAGYVYLYKPAVKPGLSKKFHYLWSGPFQVTAKLSDLNYELLGNQRRKFVVHENRMKMCHSDVRVEPKPVPRRMRPPRLASDRPKKNLTRSPVKQPLPRTHSS
jgi:hypothetical protein